MEYREYRTADLLTDADLRINIESINLSPGSINTVICNHVLEHVSDNQALREIYKVLSVGGILIVSVPLIEGWEHTYENSEVTDPILRELHFGQADHVRYYGRDFRARLRLAGFGKISEITAEGNVIEYGLCRGEKIFLCEKRSHLIEPFKL